MQSGPHLSSISSTKSNFFDIPFNTTDRPFALVHFVFPIYTDHVMILRRFDPLSCSLKRVHASITMFARQKIKTPEYHHMICIGKTKCTGEKGLFHIEI